MASSGNDLNSKYKSTIGNHAISSHSAYAAGKRRLRNPNLRRRTLSTPEITQQPEDDSHHEHKACNQARYSRPQSVSFHPDVRLFYAATTDDLEEVKMLIESGMADVNAKNPAEGATALHAASFEGNVECLHCLLKNGAKVNSRDDDGWTPLHAAVCGQKLKCVELLLGADSDSFVESSDGFTPFQMAIELRDEKLLSLFFKSMGTLLEDKLIPETAV